MKNLVLVIAALALLPTSAATAQPGALTQRVGVSGCVSESGDGGRCVDGAGLGDASALAISADGRNVYVVAPGTQSLAVFSRDAVTGTLTPAGCLTLSVLGDPECTRLSQGLSTPRAVTVSGDGLSVYVANTTGELTVFRRDPATGELSQPPGQACVASWGANGCLGSGQALSGAVDVVVAGRDVYVAGSADQAVAELRRDAASSVLTQPAGRPACISRDGTASSTTGKAADCTHAGLAFKQPFALALAPDERDLLAVDLGGHALWTFARDSTTGALDVPWCASGLVGACGVTAVHGMQTPIDVAFAPDGRQVYVASTSPGAVAVLTRTVAGSLVQPATVTAGGVKRYSCVSNDGGDGCVQGRALDGASALAVAPDGRDVYVAAPASGAIDTFERDPVTGGLRQLDGIEGCLSYDGAGGICAAGTSMEGVHALIVSPDGRNVYAVSENHGAVLTFDREPMPPVTPTPLPAPAPESAVSAAAGPTQAVPASPRITAFTASPRRFRPSSGTRLRLTLSAPAAVRITLTRRGHRRALRTLVARPGTRSLRLSGRHLTPGRYVVAAFPIDAAGRRGPARTVGLTVMTLRVSSSRRFNPAP